MVLTFVFVVAAGNQATDRQACNGSGGSEAITIVYTRGCGGTCSPGRS